MTTNGGTYRLNPNLYVRPCAACRIGSAADATPPLQAEGKVCLSLLGTWSGPGWVVGTSTLLQVLISIQAMILNDEPYLNEPGWSSQAGTAASKAYSANVRRMVVADALLNSLKRPPYPCASRGKSSECESTAADFPPPERSRRCHPDALQAQVKGNPSPARQLARRRRRPCVRQLSISAPASVFTTR